METNLTNTINYEPSSAISIESPKITERKRFATLSQLPKIFWAGVVLFSANLVVVTSISFSPVLDVGILGEHLTGTAVKEMKPSPFAEVVANTKPRPVRAAVKLIPQFVQSTEIQPNGYSMQSVSTIEGLTTEHTATAMVGAEVKPAVYVVPAPRAHSAHFQRISSGSMD